MYPLLTSYAEVTEMGRSDYTIGVDRSVFSQLEGDEMNSIPLQGGGSFIGHALVDE